MAKSAKFSLALTAVFNCFEEFYGDGRFFIARGLLGEF